MLGYGDIDLSCPVSNHPDNDGLSTWLLALSGLGGGQSLPNLVNGGTAATLVSSPAWGGTPYQSSAVTVASSGPKYVNCGTCGLDGVSAFTMAWWQKRGSSGGTTALSKSTDESHRILLEQWTGNTVYVAVSNGTNNYASYTQSSTDVSWHRFGVEFDGTRSGNAKLAAYVDGVAQSLTYSGTLPSTTPTGSSLYLGSAQNSGAATWTDGQFAGLRVNIGTPKSGWASRDYEWSIDPGKDPRLNRLSLITYFLMGSSAPAGNRRRRLLCAGRGW